MRTVSGGNEVPKLQLDTVSYLKAYFRDSLCDVIPGTDATDM